MGENTIEVMQMQIAELRELDDDRRLRDEIINEAVNALEIIERGVGAAGEKINRRKYAGDALLHIGQRWNACMPIEPRVTRAAPGAEMCWNCETPVPPGCEGTFKDDGEACRLNRRVSLVNELPKE